ncbi:MAG TPA: hypothetical protein ENH56_01540 [Roseobacter sp.]|uniref:Uncharacterized protein n=1 Tax=marine sediment metagenome TaxID=412755 RepID=A0A0F9CQ39_9ZZZZ|nr:hypothetical protein [Roseobacter sp.]
MLAVEEKYMDRSRDLILWPMTPSVSTTDAALHGTAHVSSHQGHLFTKLWAQMLCTRRNELNEQGRFGSRFTLFELNVTLFVVIQNYFKSNPHSEGAAL